MLPTREQFIETHTKFTQPVVPRYSQPLYQCPKCGGGMCKDNLSSYVIATNPPIDSDLYKCDSCGFEERID